MDETQYLLNFLWLLKGGHQTQLFNIFKQHASRKRNNLLKNNGRFKVILWPRTNNVWNFMKFRPGRFHELCNVNVFPQTYVIT